MLSTRINSLPAIAPSDQEDWIKIIQDQKSYDGQLSSLLADIWDKCHETKEHGERMAEMSWQIGKRMGLPKSQLQDLVLLAKIHDLGKTMIPNSILNKPGSLNKLEWAEMKMHPFNGYKLAKQNPTIQHLSEGILFHHEHWDGHGYPHGISGSTIPLISRIISVVDAFDTMLHDRSYRQALDLEDALNELHSNAGKQFDPDIVAIFLDLMGKPIKTAI